MKKLSEIGVKCARHPVDGGLVPYREDLAKHAIWILTPDERRELVRWSILEWEASLERIGYGNAFNELSTECIDTLLKEQGL